MVDTSVRLLLRLRRGSDTAAWERFVDQYTPLMHRWASKLGAQASDAADLVQDVMPHLIRVLPQFEYDQQRSFRAWLRTVSANKWRDGRRRKKPLVGGTAEWEWAVSGSDDVPWDDAYDRAELCREALQLIRSELFPRHLVCIFTDSGGRPPCR